MESLCSDGAWCSEMIVAKWNPTGNEDAGGVLLVLCLLSAAIVGIMLVIRVMGG